jgi:hypothetical protein
VTLKFFVLKAVWVWQITVPPLSTRSTTSAVGIRPVPGIVTPRAQERRNFRRHAHAGRLNRDFGWRRNLGHAT